MKTNRSLYLVVPFLALGVALATPRPAAAHCDTVDGPVVTDAKAALAAGDVTPALKWVQAKDEVEIRTAFAKASTARRQGDAAREVADTWFFETLVRVHRAGEGAPFDGLKPAGSVEPGIAAADRALEEGSVDPVVEELTAAVTAGVKERFAHTLSARKEASSSVAAGRGYVASYVEFIHYVERIHAAAAGPADHGEAPAAPAAHRH